MIILQQETIIKIQQILNVKAIQLLLDRPTVLSNQLFKTVGPKFLLEL